MSNFFRDMTDSFLYEMSEDFEKGWNNARNVVYQLVGCNKHTSHAEVARKLAERPETELTFDVSMANSSLYRMGVKRYAEHMKKLIVRSKKNQKVKVSWG